MTKKSTVEFRKIELEDISRTPEVFNNENDGFAQLKLVDMYGFIFPDGTQEVPVWFIRHCNPDNIRFGSFFKPGDGVLSVQEPQHYEDIAQKETPMRGYGLVDEKTYGISANNPSFEYRFTEDLLTYKEADILDLKVSPFPKGLIKHADHTTSASQISLSCLYEGTYEGKPVKGLGNFELIYFPREETRDLNSFMTYIHAYDVGIREDGKKEISLVYFSLSGESFGFYWLEGEEPVVSDQVTMDAEWIELPYAADSTCIYKKATWTFGDKKINFIGQWGSKGITSYPRYELSGQSQVYGTWYEGDRPYQHTMSMTFHENMGVYTETLKQNGFKVRK